GASAWESGWRFVGTIARGRWSQPPSGVRSSATNGGRRRTGVIPPDASQTGSYQAPVFPSRPWSAGLPRGRAGPTPAPVGPRAPHHGKAGGAAVSRLISKASGKARTSALSAITYDAVYQKDMNILHSL